MKGKNVLLLLGTTVGAGIFSLPIAYRQTGMLPFIVLLLILSYMTWRVNIYFSEIIYHVKGKHQLSGYVANILGPYMGNVSLVLHVFSTYGALIAFAFIGGTFFSQLTGLTSEVGSMFFFALATGILFISGKKLEKLDEVFAAVKSILFIILIGLAILFFPFHTYHAPVLVGTKPYLVYGLLLFSLTGFSIIPELHRDMHYKKSLLIAQLIIVVLHLIFSIALSPFVSGESFFFRNSLLTFFVNLTGFISVFTTYLLLSLVSKDLFMQDIHLSEREAQGLTAIVPFIAIFIHIGNFLKILSVTGGVFLGSIGLIICFMSYQLFPERNTFERFFIQLLYIGGIILELSSFFR